MKAVRWKNMPHLKSSKPVNVMFLLCGKEPATSQIQLKDL